MIDSAPSEYNSDSLVPEPLTEDEILQAPVLTPLQVKYLKNQMVDILVNKLNINIDPDKPMGFIQEDAYLSGQRGMLQYLLEASDASIDAIEYERTATQELDSNNDYEY